MKWTEYDDEPNGAWKISVSIPHMELYSKDGRDLVTEVRKALIKELSERMASELLKDRAVRNKIMSRLFKYLPQAIINRFRVTCKEVR